MTKKIVELNYQAKVKTVQNPPSVIDGLVATKKFAEIVPSVLDVSVYKVMSLLIVSLQKHYLS